MERQLDARAAALLERALEAKGIDGMLEAATARFVGDKRVEAVEFKDGRALAADIVVVAVGITPNAEIAQRPPVSPSSAAFSSTITSPPRRRTYSRSANAPNTAASATAWSSPPTSRPASLLSASPGATRATTAASTPPI